jgi:hypothetical protein
MINGTALFIGVESQNWTLSQFQAATNNARLLGITAVIVKIADGTTQWYSGIGGWSSVLAAIKAEGIMPIPYTYCYGDTFGGLSGEIAILKAVMSTAGIVVADMEVQWNGQVGWAQTLAAQLSSAPGIFAVTTWADPNLQNWQGVIQALKPCVDFWLPQVYTDYLASVYLAQFAGLAVVPVLSLGTDFGPNNTIQHAQNAKTPAIALWEYQAAIGSYTSIVKEIVAMNTPMTFPTTTQIQAANDSWDSVLRNMSCGRAPKGTGIYQSWLNALANSTFYGPPLTQEYSSIDWNGNPITVQEFSRARCEWSNGVPTWYSINGQV